MKAQSKNRRILTAFIGMLVFALPLLFVNFLSEKILVRSRETSEELVKEKILQEVETFKERLSPESYVNHIINSVHAATMPEARQSIIKHLPANDFGKDIFTNSLPEKFVAGLKEAGTIPLLFVSCGPSFSSIDYWFAPDLNDQSGQDSRKLALALAYNLRIQSHGIHYMNFQKNLNENGFSYPIFAGTPEIIEDRYQLFFRYISRFSDPKEDYDLVYRIFSDYFGKQFLYSYSWSCISRANIHGGYILIIRGDSLDPAKIVAYAENNSDHFDLSCKVIEAKEGSITGFSQKSDSFIFTGYLPSSFYAHLSFWKNKTGDSRNFLNEGLKFQVSGKLPKIYTQQEKVHKFVRYATILLSFPALGFFVHALLFGFNLPLAVKKKLLLVTATIFLLPIIATAILSYYLYSGFEKIVEQNIRAQVESQLNQFSRLEQEKRNCLQAKSLSLKSFLQNTDTRVENVLNQKSIVEIFPEIWDWFGGISYLTEQGNFAAFHRNRVADYHLIEGILAKYLINQGLAKLSGRRAQELDIKISVTMGILENFLTPEIEEEISTREGTVNREITHTVDTYLGCLLYCARKTGENILVNCRSSNIETELYDYLISMNLSGKNYFDRQTEFSDLKSGIRLRKHSTFTNYIWPAEIAFDNEVTSYFAKALKHRSSGTKVIRNEDGITVTSWKFKDSYQGLYVAVGKSRKLNEISYLISLIFPITAGYSIILLILISNILAQHLLGPIETLQDGIRKIDNNQFGIVLDEVPVDEFKKVTKAFNEMSIALKQKEMIGRYVSDRLIETVEKNNAASLDKAEIIEVTVLSSDIRSFTTITETYAPFEVVEMLNTYFTAMEKAITTNKGVIDQFIGDAIVAIFYHEKTHEKPPVRAAKAAMEMRRALKEYNHERHEHKQFTIENGIGIATGRVVSGSIGKESSRKTFLVTGAPTTLAADIEACTNKCENKILLCEKSAEICKSCFRLERFHHEELEKFKIFELKDEITAKPE